MHLKYCLQIKSTKKPVYTKAHADNHLNYKNQWHMLCNLNNVSHTPS